jgi:RNA polymerase sigma factor (sigma-70 family)
MKTDNPMWTEELIIAGCRDFERDAQKALYEKYVSSFRAICKRYTTDVDEANDLLHDCFIKIFTHFKQYTGNGSFEGWMKRIIINASINWCKANKNKMQHYRIDDLNIQVANEEEENKEQDTEDNDAKTMIMNAEFTKEEILQSVNQLPDGFRLVFNLYVFENYKHKEIAEELNIDINTSKSQLSRARKLLQKKLLELCKTKVMADS